jgi:L-alanine-DL-glutamate epimerase-like enolase superfamily enzyme
VELLLALGREGLVDILNLDIEGYGFTRWRALAPRAIEAGLLLSPHAFDLKLKTHYGAQLLAGVGNACPLEGVIDETEGVDFAQYALRDGLLRVPDEPGFGMKLIWGRQYNRQGLDDSGFPM